MTRMCIKKLLVRELRDGAWHSTRFFSVCGIGKETGADVAIEIGIVVGPGRGSAGGSIVSYAMDITSFDPLENGLMFERFLSPQRMQQ